MIISGLPKMPELPTAKSADSDLEKAGERATKKLRRRKP
jgi:hypothetical protein